MAVHMNHNADVWLDINNGMNRTGILPGKALICPFIYMMKCPYWPRGLHVYDGHIHDEDSERTRRNLLKRTMRLSVN